jgi:hypothetical protein
VSIAAFVTTCPLCGETIRCVVSLIVEDGTRLVVSNLVTVTDDHSPFCVGMNGHETEDGTQDDDTEHEDDE